MVFKQRRKIPREIKMAKQIKNRDIQILYGVAYGKKDREIAEELHVSHGTIRQRLPIIYALLGANGRVNAIYNAMQQGLIK